VHMGAVMGLLLLIWKGFAGGRDRHLLSLGIFFGLGNGIHSTRTLNPFLLA
jgi:hypothetical protein